MKASKPKEKQAETLSARVIKEDEEYSIGDLSREFNITLRTLRFYEDRGLLTPKRYGYRRVYTMRDKSRLALILKGKQMGFTLTEIQEMIDQEQDNITRPADLSLTKEQIEEKIQRLETQKEDIETALTELKKQRENM